MSKNKIIISLGALVALLPFLGFPTSWESVLEVIVGLAIILTSIWSTIDKKLIQKAKAQKRQSQRQVFEEAVSTENLEEEEINNEQTF